MRKVACIVCVAAALNGCVVGGEEEASETLSGQAKTPMTWAQFRAFVRGLPGNAYGGELCDPADECARKLQELEAQPDTEYPLIQPSIGQVPGAFSGGRKP